MPSNNDYLTYVLELLRELSGITYRKMMGEYILYKDGVVFGGIYDNRFLIKKTPALAPMGLKEQIPYPGAKAMLLVDCEDCRTVRELIERTIENL